METAAVSRAGTDRAGIAKIRRKVATTKDQLGKKTTALRLRNGLPATIINEGVIAKLEEG